MEHINIIIFNAINGLATRSPLLNEIMIFSAKNIVYIIPLIILVLWFKHGENNKRDAVFVAFSVGIALLLSYLTKSFYYHPRPFAIGLGVDLVSDSPSSSFPSDHTTSMFALSLALHFLRRYRLSIISFVLAFLVGFSRIFIGVHFPFDILGGIAFGAIGALVALLIAPHLYPLIDKFMKPQAKAMCKK
jgi:undecaprenyl-diphosphatase